MGIDPYVDIPYVANYASGASGRNCNAADPRYLSWFTGRSNASGNSMVGAFAYNGGRHLRKNGEIVTLIDTGAVYADGS